jgi:hypothetical protein
LEQELLTNWSWYDDASTKLLWTTMRVPSYYDLQSYWVDILLLDDKLLLIATSDC